MTDSQTNPQEDEIFGVARAIASKEQRLKYLDQVCSGDSQTRQSVEELLAIYDREKSFLESPHPDLCHTSFDNTPLESAGFMIGPYKILEVIGEGGMGNVYMAEQIEPVHRKVALKVIKSGMDSKSVIARFEAERQALALMDHPNIAKFYDAGISDSGSPYFVMELVKGRPIIQFCQQHKLDLKAKLDLFSQVCNGVQHAHQKGIIHRDLKPSNVLIARYDDRPVVKIIDFGVAKAIGEKLTEKTLFTRFGQLVGTLEYMSPEQAQLNQLDVDTRSDIYSLGAILYELLAGEPPFEKERLSSAALDEVLRIIREDEPSKPSTRLSSLSATDQAADSGLHRSSQNKTSSIPADMDWIVMKCLEKDRSRRYATTNELDHDIQRYLNSEPVSAGPPTATYRMQKFFRRNRVGVFVGSVVSASLLLGVGISTWQAIRATRSQRSATAANLQLTSTLSELKHAKEKADDQLNMAETEQRRATELLNYVVGTLRSPLAADRADAKVIDILRDAAANAESEFSDEPIIAARILQSIAETYTFLERGDDAIPIAIRAQEMLVEHLGVSHPEALKSFHYVYWAHRKSPGFENQRDELLTEARKLRATCMDELDENDAASVLISLVLADVYSSEANTAFDVGNWIADQTWKPESDALINQALAATETWKNDPSKLLVLTQVLKQAAEMHFLRRNHASSLDQYQELLSILSNHYELNDVKILAIKTNIANLQSVTGDHAQAKRLSSELLERFETKFGEHDRLTIYRRAEHALIVARDGDVQAANDSIRTAAQQAEQLFQSTSFYLKVLDRQVDVLLELGNIDTAIDVLDTRIKGSPTIASWSDAAVALWHVIRQLNQGAHHQYSVEILERFLPPLEKASLQHEVDSRFVQWIARIKESGANAHRNLNDKPKAIQLLEESLETQFALYGNKSEHILILQRLLFELNFEIGRYGEATRIAEERVSRIRREFKEVPQALFEPLYWLGFCYYYSRQYDESIRSFQECIDVGHIVAGELLGLGRPVTQAEALEFCRNMNDGGVEKYLSANANLASAYLANGEPAKAKKIAEQFVAFYFEYRESNIAVQVALPPAVNVLATIDYKQAGTNQDFGLAEKAAELMEDVVPNDRHKFDLTRPGNKTFGQLLSKIYMLLEKFQDAAEILEVYVAHEREKPKFDPGWEFVLQQLGYCEFRLGDLEKAKQLLTEFLEIMPEIKDAPNQIRDVAKHQLGAVLIAQGEIKKGELLLVQGANGYWEYRDKFEPHTRRHLVEVLDRVIEFYSDRDDAENVELWRSRLQEFDESGEK